jgi:hypothetical protein
MLYLLKGGRGRSRRPRDRETVVGEVFDAAGFERFNDPRNLAAGLGYRPCPDLVVEDAALDGPWLLYQQRLDLRARGSAIYLVLASSIVGPADALSVADAMVLPFELARCSRLDTLVVAQPHARVAQIDRIWRAAAGSEAFSIEEFPPASQR